MLLDGPGHIHLMSCHSKRRFRCLQVLPYSETQKHGRDHVGKSEGSRLEHIVRFAGIRPSDIERPDELGIGNSGIFMELLMPALSHARSMGASSETRPRSATSLTPPSLKASVIGKELRGRSSPEMPAPSTSIPQVRRVYPARAEGRFALRECLQHCICFVRLRLACKNTAALAFRAYPALRTLEISGLSGENLHCLERNGFPENPGAAPGVHLTWRGLPRIFLAECVRRIKEGVLRTHRRTGKNRGGFSLLHASIRCPPQGSGSPDSQRWQEQSSRCAANLALLPSGSHPRQSAGLDSPPPGAQTGRHARTAATSFSPGASFVR